MKLLTKVYKQSIIDNVYPDNLNKDDIKEGLRLKEELINEITDEYIEENFPHNDDIQEMLDEYGISDEEYQKFSNGEIDASKITFPKIASTNVFYKISKYNEINKEYEVYGDWIEITSNKPGELPIGKSKLMFKIEISGDNYKKYKLLTDDDIDPSDVKDGMRCGWLSNPGNVSDLEFNVSEDDIQEPNKIYLSNEILFNKSEELDKIGVYFANEWFICKYRVLFYIVSSIALS